MVKHECDKCKRAKARIVSILKTNPEYQNVSTDDDSKKPKFPAQKVSDYLPEKDYWPDIYFEMNSKLLLRKMFTHGDGLDEKLPLPVIIEVDHIQKGSSSHRSKTSTQKDTTRDKHFLSKGIPTVRFNLREIVGNRHFMLGDAYILELIEREIEYQLRTVKN